jgi:hypothetical protein
MSEALPADPMLLVGLAVSPVVIDMQVLAGCRE